MSDALQEVRVRLRSLVRSPGYTAVVVFTIALGLGVNAAVFSLLDTVVLRPLPYDQPDRLVLVTQALGREAGRGVAAVDIEYFSENVQTLPDLAWGLTSAPMTLTGFDAPEAVMGREVSASFFSILGARAARGRLFQAGDDQTGTSDIVVLTHDFWRARFGGDPGIVGRTLQIDGRSRTVVGVTDPEFRYELEGVQDLFIPRVFDPESANYTDWLRDHVIGRLADGVGLEAAREEFRAIAVALEETDPVRRTDVPIFVNTLKSELVSDSATGLFILFGAVTMVLIVASANLAHLILARSAARAQERSLRQALGASRGALVRASLIEATLLMTVGGLLGLALAGLVLPGLTALSPTEIPGLGTARIDGRVWLFAAATALVMAGLFGLLPHVKRGPVSVTSARPGAGSVGRRSGHLLMTAETALVTGLLFVSILFVTSLRDALRVNPGFDAARRVAVKITSPAQKYPTAAEVQVFFNEVRDRVGQIPGVEAVGGLATLPLEGEGITIPAPTPEGVERQGPAVASGIRTGWDAVSGDPFDALGIPVRFGRTFTEEEMTTVDTLSPPIIVNEAFVQAVFGEPIDAVGRRVGFGTPPSLWMEIVGVVGDVRHDDLRTPGRVAFYQPAGAVTFAWPTMHFVIRTRSEPGPLLRAVREAVWEVDPGQPVPAIRELDEVVASSLARERYQVVLTLSFAAIALILGFVGIYGIVRYSTVQRTGEIGVRLALGATGTDVRGMILRETLVQVGTGIALGLAGGIGAGWLLRVNLFGISPTDPVSAIAVAVAILGVATAAAFLPAARASRSDVVVALRGPG